jgi:hypothetical protein
MAMGKKRSESAMIHIFGLNFFRIMARMPITKSIKERKRSMYSTKALFNEKNIVPVSMILQKHE